LERKTIDSSYVPSETALHTKSSGLLIIPYPKKLFSYPTGDTPFIVYAHRIAINASSLNLSHNAVI